MDMELLRLELKKAIGGCDGCCECQHTYLGLGILTRKIKTIEKQIEELL